MEFMKLDDVFDAFNLADGSERALLVPGLPRGNLAQLLAQRELGLNSGRRLASSGTKRRALGLRGLVGPFGQDSGVSGAVAEDQMLARDRFEVTLCELKGLPDPMLALGAPPFQGGVVPPAPPPAPGAGTRSTFLMVFSPDKKLMASTHGDHNVYVTEVKTGKCVQILKGHPRTPWCVAFHPSHSGLIASGCLGGQVRR